MKIKLKQWGKELLKEIKGILGLFLIIFFLILTISSNCQQVIKITGTTSDITSQYTQLQKTNDSIKTVLVSLKILIVKYKADSIYYVNWTSTKNAQMKLKIDSITSLKLQLLKPTALQKTVDSLKNIVSQYNLSIAQFITGDQLASFGKSL